MQRPEFMPVVVSAGRRARLIPGISLLCEAAEDARACGCDPWEFAVHMWELLGAGLTAGDLRWLLARGYARQARECSRPDRNRREFRTAANLAFSVRSCFVLTETGLVLAATLARPPAPDADTRAAPPDCDPPPSVPFWDPGLRELRWQGRLVKRFRTPAPSQEHILSAFQEEGWPTRIDDPLTRGPGVDPGQRLHDAVRGLNRNQRHPALRFWRDGKGQGVCWAPHDPANVLD